MISLSLDYFLPFFQVTDKPFGVILYVTNTALALLETLYINCRKKGFFLAFFTINVYFSFPLIGDFPTILLLAFP